MSTISRERHQSEAIQSLFDGLMRVNRSIRSRSGDWGHVAHDLSRGDIVTLGVIARAERTRPGQIAAALCVDPSVVSRQLATLHRLDLITRGVDPSDRRAELISVTEQGRGRLREARDAMCDALAARLTGWDSDAIARAAAVVDDLADLLQDNPDTADSTTTTSKDAHA
jgi:DNA-binding MarR family transcriptional regulator